MTPQELRLFDRMMFSNYDICNFVTNLSGEQCHIVAKLLYFDLNESSIDYFFNKSNEWLLEHHQYVDSSLLETEIGKTYITFLGIFNLIKDIMIQTLRKRLNFEETDIELVLTNKFGEIYRYMIDLESMKIYHRNKTGEYILNYDVSDSKWIEYLIKQPQDVSLDSGSSPNIIQIYRNMTQIHVFNLQLNNSK
jgi:hypothetical protein